MERLDLDLLLHRILVVFFRRYLRTLLAAVDVSIAACTVGDPKGMVEKGIQMAVASLPYLAWKMALLPAPQRHRNFASWLGHSVHAAVLGSLYGIETVWHNDFSLELMIEKIIHVSMTTACVYTVLRP